MGLVVSIVTARAEVHRRRGAAGRTPRPPIHIWPVSAPRSEVRDERLGTCSLGICGPQMVPNFELFSVNDHRIVAVQSAFFLVELTGFEPATT